MDRSWMVADRTTKVYENGVEQFLEFGLLHAYDQNRIRCPCLKCGNMKVKSITEVREHLYFNGIDQTYIIWYWHGETLPNSDSPSGNAPSDANNMETGVSDTIKLMQAAQEQFEPSNAEKFEKILNDVEQPIYPGCLKYTKFSTLSRLYNIKGKYGWSDTSFSELLSLLRDLLPENNEIPTSMYEAKKTLKALGMSYEKIHSCPNDCILYRKNYSAETKCPTCGLSRWKTTKKSYEKESVEKVGVPAKVFWYFPPTPRFKRMFQNSQTAKDLTWHDREREVDGKMRHPADSPSWKVIDHMWPAFASDSRNLRLAISADGINPHKSMNTQYSCWPIILITYNLPPWLCMKRKFLMLTLLISGPNQPGNDIDVYLEPLVDDLHSLWEVGVQTYDAFKQEWFTLKAVLMWTINDFPAYGNMSGCCVKGYKACPVCGENTYSEHVKHSKKISYTGHRRFLPHNHSLRRQKKAFNGKQEFEFAPEPLIGEEVLQRVEGITNNWGKMKVKRRRRKGDAKMSKNDVGTYWKKKSIFFQLPYWKSLYVRHTLDVMHIEKNVCESVYGTLLDIPGKTKDGVKARMDLIKRGLRAELRLEKKEKGMYIPPACYTLSKAEKQILCKTLYDIKVPEGYSSNFRNLVSMKDLKIVGPKSHDCHMLMQQLLPVAIRNVLPKHVRYAITRLCYFFNAICSKVIDVLALDEIESELVVTLCLLEKIFPPSFFDIMVHLTVHLVRQVRLCGPSYLDWMYPFERNMHDLKGYVRNRNCPEGYIAECYIAEEAIEFCAEFIPGVSTIGIPQGDGKHQSLITKPISGSRVETALHDQWEQAHRIVLENTIEVQPYIEEHMQQLKVENPSKSKSQKWLLDQHNRCFMYWLRQKVVDQINLSTYDISEYLRWIAHGPRPEVMKYSGYIINGCHYHTKARDDLQVQQNSGVSIVAKTMQLSSAKDKNPVISDMTYYGVIQEIWELDYTEFKIPVFKCDWFENNNGIKVDDIGFTLVNFGKLGHKSDTFVLANQVKKVFYVEDPVDSRWSVVLSTPQRDWMDDDIGETVLECFTKSIPPVETFDVLEEKNSTYLRTDHCEGTLIEDDG